MPTRRSLLIASTAGLAAGSLALTGCMEPMPVVKDYPAPPEETTPPIVLAPNVKSLRGSDSPEPSILPDEEIKVREIRTPSVHLMIEKLTVLPYLHGIIAEWAELPGTEGVGPRNYVRPADGQEFLVVEFWSAGWTFAPGEGRAPKVAIKVDNRRDIVDLGGPDTYQGNYRKMWQKAVLSVPVGSQLSLVVEDADLTSSYDLRTGLGVPDAGTTRLRGASFLGGVKLAPVAPEWEGGWSDGLNNERLKVTWEIDPDSAYLGYWIPDKGWAPKASKWLVLQYQPSYEVELGTDMRLNLRDDVTLRTASGNYHPETKESVDAFSWILYTLNEPYLIFAVPDDFKEGTLEVAFPRTLTAKYRDGQTRRVRNRGADKQLTTTITSK